MPEDREPATITPYRDGPLIVRGNFRLQDADGNEIDPGRDTVALCRCGKSGLKPFCDGSHKKAGFSAPSAPRSARPTTRLAALDRGEEQTITAGHADHPDVVVPPPVQPT